MTYDELTLEADKNNVIIKENRRFKSRAAALINGNIIGISKSADTSVKKACLLAEELGHFHTTTGNILDQSECDNRKQEYRARLWSFDKQVGLQGIISAFNARCMNNYDMAEFLNVTEEFLKEAIEFYRRKYGIATKVDNYIIGFEPTLYVMEMFE